MRRTLLALGIVLCGAARLAAQASDSAPAGPTPAVTVLKAARMFDGRSDTIVRNAVVLVEGSKIAGAGPGLPIPAGAAVVDLGDATLLPGFIDSHTHLTGEAGESYLADFFENLRRTAPEQAILASGYARRLLEAGFTTVRNVGATDDVARSGRPVPPRPTCSGSRRSWAPWRRARRRTSWPCPAIRSPTSTPPRESSS